MRVANILNKGGYEEMTDMELSMLAVGFMLGLVILIVAVCNSPADRD